MIGLADRWDFKLMTQQISSAAKESVQKKTIINKKRKVYKLESAQH